MFEKYRVTQHERRLTRVFLLPTVVSRNNILWTGDDMPTAEVITELRDRLGPQYLEREIYAEFGLVEHSYVAMTAAFEISKRFAGVFHRTVAIAAVAEVDRTPLEHKFAGGN